ncbi:unnamed protein product [Gemmataceae bacterium]|nr:unnamed protein product [Gemmataceae bacterium]VTU01037.1 unnamed protein product [Gemmataceae bacterium]
MSITTAMREYLANIAERLIDASDMDEEQKLIDRNDRIWETFTQDEKDHLNELVEDIFGQWI